MARDYYDESKDNKKKEEKKKAAAKPQSSSGSKPKSTPKLPDFSHSTFMGGGASVKAVEKNVSSSKPSSGSKPKSTPSKPKSSPKLPDFSHSTFMGGGASVKAVERTVSTRHDHSHGPAVAPIQRDKNRDANLNLKQTQGASSRKANSKILQHMGESARKAQAMKNGTATEKAKPGTRRAKIEEWDHDIADTVMSTIKQGLAADARVANLGMKGITQKDAFLYTTKEQRDKADKKVEARDKKLGKAIEKESAVMQDIQDKHGYIGKQALSAVSSAAGMGMDIAAGAIIPGSSLFHMGTRSTGTSLGEVNKKADNLRNQLKQTGQYTDDELDEMFRNVDALDMANAAASGGIEVLSELLFPGIGAARKVIGGKGMSIAERAGAKLFNKVGARATGGLLRNMTRGTLEEVAEEEIGGPLQAMAFNIIYGNKFQRYNEDAIKSSLASESNALRSNIRSEADAQATAARLSSQAFMDESVNSYLQSGYSKKESTKLAELSREYLTASLTGDVDAMKKYQDEMVKIMAGGENSQKQKFSLQDAIDAAVSTSMLTMVTGAPTALSTMQIGNSFKENNGLNAVKQQAEIIKNWSSDPKDKAKAQAVIDHIDRGGDLSGTQVYEIIQKTGALAEESKQPEAIKNRTAQVEMNRRDLRISPVNADGSLAPQTQQRYEQIVSDTVSRHATLARLSNSNASEDFVGPSARFSQRNANTENEDMADVYIGANIGAAFKVGAINSEMVNELARGSETVKSVFREVTGIDVRQFSSCSEMNEAIMAEAADNMVNSARLEQIAWNDETRKQASDALSKGLGSKGDLAVQDALDSVDPRDRTQFLMTADVARNLYDFARHTEGTWNEAKSRYKGMYPAVDMNVLRNVFDAAKTDKDIAETEGYGKVVTSGKPIDRGSLKGETAAYVPGKFTDKRENKEGATLTGESLAKNIASAFGINVELVDSLESEVRDSDGNVVLDEQGMPLVRQDNGMFIPATNTLVINANADATRTVTQTAVHELTHHIAVYAPEEYLKLSRYIMDAWYRKDAAGFNRAIKARQAAYKAQKNQTLSDEQALEEIIADGSADFDWADEDFIAEVTTKEPTLASKIIDAIKNVLQRLRSILASGDLIDDMSREALYDKVVEFDTVRSMWVKAAQTARKAQADQAIDEWQDEANKASETRFSINDADILSAEETQNRLEENFDDYKEDKDNLRLATEAITDLQNVRYSVEENTSDISGRRSREEQVRTIGKGITADLVNEGYIEFRGRKVKGPEDLARLCQVLRDPRFETFRVVLTKGDKIVSLRSISSRLPGLAQAFESEDLNDGIDIVRDRMKRTGADGYYLIHNHPSGNVTASFADLSVTRAYLALLGQDTYKGHIILDHDKYGFIDADVPQVIRGENYPTAREETIPGQQTFDLMHEPEIDHPLLGEEIHGHTDVAKYGQFVNASDDVSVLLYTNSPGEVTGIQEISNKTLKNNKEITGFIRNQGVEFGAASAFLYTTDIETYQASKDLVKSGHLVDSVVAYGNNRQWSESAREVVSPRADVEVLGQVHDDVIRRTHVFESATGASNYDGLKYSITPQMDADYMAAVNSGNMEEAQRLVDEAAGIAGMKVAHRYHGTMNANFTVFDKAYAKVGGNSGAGFYFSTEEDDSLNHYQDVEGADNYFKWHELAEAIWDTGELPDGTDIGDQIGSYEEAVQYAKDYLNKSPGTFDVYLNYKNPYVRNGRSSTNIYNLLYDDFDESIIDKNDYDTEDEYEEALYDERSDEIYRQIATAVHDAMIDIRDFYEVIDSPTEYDIYNAIADHAFSYEEITWDSILRAVESSGYPELIRDDWTDSGYGATEITRAIIENFGYDAIEDKEVSSKFGQLSREMMTDTEHIIVFKPEQIKLSDPVTYAEDGSVIPLSERFDPTNNDIRYSLPTMDADGNILTDGQMEYFKNSQARDRNGKLAVVYHTTNAGGFTVFDPEYSDDKRSLFFTSNFDMSQSYGTNAFRNLMREGTENISFDEFIKMDGPSISTVVATRLIDLLDPETGEVLWDGTENPVGTGSTLKYWYKKDNSKYLVSVGGEVMDREGFDRWMNEQAEDILYGYKNHGYYECYLNLEDPLIIECNGSNWDSIKEPDFESLFLSYDGEDFYIDGTTVPFSLEDIRDLYGVGFAERAEEWIETADPTDLEMGDTLYTWHGGPYDPEVEGHWPTEEDTRYWCNEAEALGYDGVIFRDLKDNGPYGKFKETGDVYVAFSSNQVKDINNENPSENPDIRYSIVPEDEAMSKIAYDDAMDDSYEALAYYEQQLGNVNPETFDFSKAFKEEDVAKFFDALKAEDAVPSADAVFEADRVRRAKSKEDFYNNVNAKWNDRWTTEGEVLDIKSVKKAITSLVKGTMANSNSDAQYRNEIVRKTLIDARTAYQLMKQDRTDIASYLLYHSAQRMMDGLEFIRDDTAFKEYKEIRDFLRGYRINAPEEYWENEIFHDFRKEYFGRLKIGKGNSNIEDVYQDCQDRWPHLFNEAEREKAGLGDAAEDLLLHIGVVVDSNVTPFMEAYSSEEAASLAFDIADQLYEIIANGDRVVSLADSYKERFDAKTKAMKQRHYEAILRERKIREEGIQKERQKFRAYKEKQKEKGLHTKHFEGIKKKYDELTKRLLTNTKDKHIPEQYKKELAELLKGFDFQTVGSKKREARTGYKAQNTIRLKAMRTALERIEANSQIFHINDSITDIMKDLLGLDDSTGNKQSIEGKTLDELSASELKKIDKLLGALLHEFNNYEKVRVGVKKQQAADIAHAQNTISLEHAEMFGQGKDYQNTPGWIDKILNLDEMTAAYLFKRIDPNKEGLGLMFGEIRKSFDKYVRNQAQLNDWMEEIVGKYHNKGILWNKYGSGELTNWRSDNYAQTFDLDYGPLRLTVAQMMSVACLANRQQAYDHMIGDGVVVAPVTFNAKMLSDIKKKPNKAVSQKLTDADIKTITAALTPEQRQVANKLQELMATKMAAWGNEASMNVLGIKLFEDPDYFPIRSDKAGLTKDLDPNQFEQAIRNFGFTKAVQPGAKNAIMIEDIFDVVTEHCNNMNLYNSYTEAMNDFMKVYNYKEVREEGTYTVEQALKHAYSNKAATFIMQFMRDLNGNVSGRASGIEDAYNSLLANSKKAAVFANLRVAVQQPTAITRAFAVINPKYIKGIKIEKGAMKEMFEHCPIALWKSWGYYDINMGKNIEDIMMNNGKWLEDKATDLYGALDNVTWTAIWQMVKAEMKDTHPNVKAGTDEYWELCNERMSEIVDLTQVVDSPMHRSHAMRDKGFLKKTATAFMAEPTLTFNMIRDGWVSAREAWKSGDKAKATKIANKTIAVTLLQAATVGGFAAIVDALRKKKPDKDDDDDRFLHLWWVNALENFENELQIWNKVYFVKDIASIFEGWENSNLALQGIQKFALGYRQLTGDPYARSSAAWYENMADGIGYMWGIPIKTMRTGLANAMNNLGLASPFLESVGENLDNMARDPKEDASAKSAFIGSFLSDDTSDGMFGKLLATKSETADSETTSGTMSEDDLPDNLTDEQKKEILKAGEKRAKKKEAEEPAGQLDYDTMLYNAMKAAAGLEGEEYNKKVYSSVAQGLKGYIADGDYMSIGMMRTVIEQAGGDVEYFDQRVLDETKSAYKKTLGGDLSYEERWDQKAMYRYMMSHGMTQEEVSSEILYKSDLAKDMKVAYRVGDNDMIYESMLFLADAGMTETDFERLYETRNRMDLTKYKQNGRYRDRLKSMGTFIWPASGTITSHFGYRNAPTAGASSNHPAIDIGVPVGTPVAAADGGVVIYAGSNSGYGNSVGIKHDNGMVTYYNHLDSWCVNVGDTVAQGQTIAASGNTGISTGPHLDFKILDKDGNPVDPEKYLQ